MIRNLPGPLVIVLLLWAPAVVAQEKPADAEARPTGLPGTIDWTFNFDAAWGTFGFNNSLFDNPKEPVPENLSDQWFEGYIKPGLSASYTFASSSQIYGKVSAAGERTYGSVPELFGEDVSSFWPDDLFIGWRSGTSLDMGENALDLVVGRAPYRLGHGFLLYDGTAEGGSRGGYWSNARKAFEFAAIARLQPGSHKAETFYLDKDELDEADTGSRLWGANYEYSIGEDTTLGATYMQWFADADVRPERDGLDVFNVRAFTAPVPDLPDLSFEFEYAAERHDEALDSNAWTAQGAYELSGVNWQPKFSYRYAFFEGDDPATPENEAFDPLFLGFYDWGTWWQGEIAGEYFLSNSNLISHLFRIHLTPSDAVGGGLLFFKFLADRPETFGPGVASDKLAFEMDAYADWKINANFTLSLVAAFANPQEGVQEATGRTANFGYGMAYVAYAF
jgi:hypothetical protein